MEMEKTKKNDKEIKNAKGEIMKKSRISVPNTFGKGSLTKETRSMLNHKPTHFKVK